MTETGRLILEPMLLSVKDAGRMIGISRPSIYKLLASGEVKAVKLGGRTLIRMESLRDYVDTLASYPVTASDTEQT